MEIVHVHVDDVLFIVDYPLKKIWIVRLKIVTKTAISVLTVNCYAKTSDYLLKRIYHNMSLTELRF